VREPGAAQVLSGARLVTAAGVVALAVPRTLAVTWTQLGTPFDLTLEAPAVNTILLLREGVNVYEYYVRRERSRPVPSVATPGRGRTEEPAGAGTTAEAPARLGVARDSAGNPRR